MTGVAQNKTLTIALDASTRRYDADGRLHVSISNISKANVCGYYGREIPGATALGLLPDQMYQLYRDAGELAQAAATFNNLPLLQTHKPVNAIDPAKELVVGSTGTNAEFAAPYLRNSLVIWDADAIRGIESGNQKELSCGYRYVPVMEPGEADGMKYDGRMTQIVGNHVALVEVGRAGPDVVIGDSQPSKDNQMATKHQSRAVRAAKMALDAVAGGKIAPTASIEDIKKLLAADEYEDMESMSEDDEEDDADEKAKKEATAKRAADKKGMDKKGMDKDGDELKGLPKALDKDQDDEDEDKIEKAMDAAIASVRAETRALRLAERAVRPYVGDLALDSAESADDVYRAALKLHGIATDGVHPSAFPAMLKLVPLPGAGKASTVAMDGAATASVSKKFPSLSRIGRA